MRVNPTVLYLRTGFDSDDAYAAEQYIKGVNIGHEFDFVYITPGGAWGAQKHHCALSAPETLGLHKSTAELMQGFMDSGVPIIDRRFMDDLYDPLAMIFGRVAIYDLQRGEGEVWLVGIRELHRPYERLHWLRVRDLYGALRLVELWEESYHEEVTA